ncbi:hypothetical protein A3F06_00135 [candidate division TM6 bacterium RIFCSPHIGHO2_12_FULL_36_22]|nr:MAG: hypothetical protein A3F06_00135 [candidate division TM6 bacterium RIFCSPHIGHO2_12_FULL_36_22]
MKKYVLLFAFICCSLIYAEPLKTTFNWIVLPEMGVKSSRYVTDINDQYNNLDRPIINVVIKEEQ